ncbi:MAG TPA: PH domain-containing protein [Blastocatellia bacterium]|nr:PH domain-containing protein [Blastocatellia bacterium]
MYCNQCGEVLPPTSRFCNVCGSAVVANRKVDAERGRAPKDDYEQIDATPRRARDLKARNATADAGDLSRFAPNEEVIFTLRPTLLFVFARYVVAALCWIAAAAGMGLFFGFTWLGLLILLAIGLVLFAVPIYKHILRRREVYTLTNHKLEMRYGLLAKIVRNIPLRNIQDVTVTASAWQRLINIGDIVIDSASESGKIVLDDIHYPERYASIVMGELRRRN